MKPKVESDSADLSMNSEEPDTESSVEMDSGIIADTDLNEVVNNNIPATKIMVETDNKKPVTDFNGNTRKTSVNGVVSHMKGNCLC